ncbi:heat shock protein HspQ [Pacificimonas sp. ICDLI1SI03]|jgi:heat shock protein HspQ|tara:strand:+ start:9619 stop:9996 length:378 start_codon:yes stop_codon:yes gene_type:complete
MTETPNRGAPRTSALDAIVRQAAFGIGDVVKHRLFDFRGIIFDVDPEFANTDEWWEAIPEEVRPKKDQPYYHLLADNGQDSYVAYVSQQNLLHDDNADDPIHPAISDIFEKAGDGRYRLKPGHAH